MEADRCELSNDFRGKKAIRHLRFTISNIATIKHTILTVVCPSIMITKYYKKNLNNFIVP